MDNQSFIIYKDELLRNLTKILLDYQVAALTNKAGKVLYDFINKADEILFEYQPTVLPPKKFFFPQQETLLEYNNSGDVIAKVEARPLVLFGLRPCDLNGFKILREAFAEGHGDPNYLEKHNQSIVIGMDCKQICDEDAFCYKVESHEAKGGYDIMLYELDDVYGLDIATERGSVFVEKYLTTKEGSDEIARFKEDKKKIFSKEMPFKKLKQFPEIFEANKSHKVWEEEGARCLSCGSCIMVCPTCYCFDVKDEMDGDLKTGKRVRLWDGCMLDGFATVATGENFRGKSTSRLQHRINRKFNYLMKKHGQSVCVGCGRCVRACLADISPKGIAEKNS